MPHYPLHSPYLYSLSKKHGEIVNPGGSSSAAEAIALSTVCAFNRAMWFCGWSRYWDDLGHFISQVHSPGLGLVAAPLKIRGGTASPIRPIALAPEENSL